MRRETAMYSIIKGMEQTVESACSFRAAEINAVCEKVGAKNASAWAVEGFLYLYAEFDDDNEKCLKDVIAPFANELSFVANEMGSDKDMELMYHDFGVVREDKSLIRRRVFATVLKLGCAPEYKARHQKLIDARGDKLSDGPETNFSIRCALGRYIFGYCELVKSYDHELTEEEKADKIAWETRQLEIMDWLTDDVDWITGQKHSAMKQLFVQEGY